MWVLFEREKEWKLVETAPMYWFVLQIYFKYHIILVCKQSQDA